jgi:hypothetical protein
MPGVLGVEHTASHDRMPPIRQCFEWCAIDVTAGHSVKPDGVFPFERNAKAGEFVGERIKICAPRFEIAGSGQLKSMDDHAPYENAGTSRVGEG